MAYRNDSSNVDYRTGYTGKKEKVMRLLISKYYLRITSRITELEHQRKELEADKARIKQTLEPKGYCAIICRIAELQDRIELLKSLL
jgi:hypothetical protein